jgi:hypothetical protein
VPYASRGAPPSVRTDPAWTLECGAERADVLVEEAEVLAGAFVPGPALCLGVAPPAAGGPARRAGARLR